MHRFGLLRILSFACAIVTMLILSSRPSAADIIVDVQDLRKPVTFYMVEFLSDEELVVTIRNIHWAKQGEIGMYEDSTAAQNPDSDMIAFRNVGPSARITFDSDPANLNFGPLHDFRILWSEAKQGTTIPFELDTNIAGIAIDVTIVSDNESSFYSDSLTLQAVPEPGAAALVSAGLMTLATLGTFGIRWGGQRK
jgi:hypothetical protein